MISGMALAVISSLAWLAAPTGAEPSPLAEGARHYAARADEVLGDGRAAPEAIDAAISAWERGLEQDPDDVELRLCLVEALYFKGQFASADARETKRLFTHAAELAEGTARLVDSRALGGERPSSLSASERAASLRSVPHAADAHFWAAIGWGLWAMSHSKAASGFKGVAKKIRDHAELLIEIDPDHADGGGYRLLGKLHADTPRVALFTGFVDPGRGIDLLERANEVSTDDPRNPLFLAQALLEHAPERRDEALALLRDVVARTPRPDHRLEQEEMIRQARDLLAEAEGGGP